MLKPWSYHPTADIKAMSSLVRGMRDVLSALDGASKGKTPFSSEELVSYCRSLVRGQRGSLGATKSGSWSVAPSDAGMPADARVDFIFTPTYLAVATLSRVLFDYPWVPIEVAGYRRALKRGLDFCAYRGLSGSGYEAISGMLDAFVILAIGRVPVLLEANPRLSPSLAKVIAELETYLRTSLLNEKAIGYWGEDLTAGYQAALETLYLSRDAALVRAVAEERTKPSSAFSKDLPW